MKHIKNLSEHNKLLLVLAIGWTAVVAYFSLMSSGQLPSLPRNFDKIAHAVFHFGITLLWFLYFKTRKLNTGVKKSLIDAFLFSLFFGISIEVSQEFFTKTRHADIIDVLANTFGATLVFFLIFLIKKIVRSRSEER